MTFHEGTSAKSWDRISDNPVAEAAVVATLIFVACLVGIQTRLVFSLASIWPANALFLGLLLTRPRAKTPLTWALTFAAFVAADILTGSDLFTSTALTLVNCAGVASGMIMTYALTRGAELQLRRPVDATVAILVMAAAAFGAAIGGMIAGPIMFNMDPVSSFGVWFAGEFVNYSLFLPVALALASKDPLKFRLLSRDPVQFRYQALALASLVFLLMSAHFIGGPLAGAYIVPGILWCAIAFRPVPATCLAMIAGTWVLIAGPLDLIPLRIDFDLPADAASFRLGVGMIALGTFVVSVINSVWRHTHNKLLHIASYDALTGLLNRRALIERLNSKLMEPRAFSLQMIDVDHFKSINDTYGHAIGDKALEALSGTIQESLRSHDFAGRLGGEEFAIARLDTSPQEGIASAERLREAIAAIKVAVPGQPDIQFTASIGVAATRPGVDLKSLLSAADGALYLAKTSGRNQVRSADQVEDLLGVLPTPETPGPIKRRFRDRPR